MDQERIISEYRTNFRPGLKRLLDWYRQQSTLSEAIRKAALGMNTQEKKHPHQWRIPKEALDQAGVILLKKQNEIEMCNSFDSLYKLFEELVGPIKGLGELYIYDTALRIGAKLSLLPDKVYLQAGARVGAKALGLNAKSRTVEITFLPVWLHMFKAYELEDLLCIFKNSFDGSNKKETSKKSGKLRHCN